MHNYTRKCTTNYQHQPTHFDPTTKQFLHVFGDLKYEYGTHGCIVTDALTCGSIYKKQQKITVYYSPLQPLTFRTVR